MGNILGTPRMNREELEETGTPAIAGRVGEEEPQICCCDTELLVGLKKF